MSDLPNISIIVPLYNEEEVVPLLFERLDELIANFTFGDIEIVLVDDGSKDQTSRLIVQKAEKNSHYTTIILSRNFGHQRAITAGIEMSRGTEGIMIIDGDLQDPPELLFDFYSHYKKGFDIVYAIREDRKENWIKKTCYHLFYRILNALSEIDLPLDSGDFCFISRKATNELIQLNEESRYLRGLRAWIGFKQIGIPYSRDIRIAGTSKYTFQKLVQLAHNGLYNFSNVPLKMLSYIGFSGIFISIVYFIYILISHLLSIEIPTGFTTIIFVIIFFGCIQLLSLSILGQYLLRIFFQVKKRPLYIIDRVISKHHLK